MRALLTVFLGLLTLLAVSLQRTYSKYSVKELKHRVRGDDKLAAAILKAAGYEHSLRAVLWTLTGLAGAGFFVMVSLTAPLWFALTASIVLIWLGFVWIPAARVSYVSQKLAAWCAPALGKLLAYLHPLIDTFVRFGRHHRAARVHTGLYDKHDVIHLLERQQKQPDNRVEAAELEIALHGMRFGDDTVAQHMVLKRRAKAVSADEPLGPIVMDELHGSGHKRFPVYEGKPDNIVGTLYLRDLVRARGSGTVRSLMKPEVTYLHEDQSLKDALQAVSKTHRQLFIVVDSDEQYIGIITVEDILGTILGRPVIDDFDDYDNLHAVANRAAKKDNEELVEEAVEPEAPKTKEPEEDKPKKSPIKEEDIDETIELE